MDEGSNNPLAAIYSEIRAIIREEIRDALFGWSERDDRLITAEEAAKILSVSPDWLYRRSKRLPFTRKIHRKMIRFSFQGIQKYIAEAKQF